LKRGDLITKINAKPVKNGMDVRFILSEFSTGQSFEIEFIRTDKGIEQKIKVKVVLTEKKEKK
ncbi:MAG: hypothetical protein AAB885_03365, partial [Patescibacteria group bacterium]